MSDRFSGSAGFRFVADDAGQGARDPAAMFLPPIDTVGIDSAGPLSDDIGKVTAQDASQTGLAVFSAFDPTNGQELWVTDGTAAGTMLLNPFNGLNAGFDAALAFADLDGDGDLDAVSGTRDGTFVAFRNDSTNGVPITVNFTAQNDAPTTANLQGDVVNYTEQLGQKYLDLGANATIADPDSGNFNGGSLRVQITAGLQAGVDFIFFVGNGRVSLSGQSAGATVFVQLAGDASPVAIGTLANDNLFQNNTLINFNSDNATPARVQELLRSITYNGNSDNLTSGQRTITYTLNDGDGGSSTTTSFVDVTAVNDVPVVNAGAGQASFSEGVNVASTPVAVASGLTVSDPDNATFASATVTISANREASDVLAFTNTNSIFGNIAASYDAATGVLTMTSAGATATRTQFQAALRAVTFTSTSEEPSTATRTISFVVNDGAANSVASTRQVLVQANNDAPSGTSQILTINEDQVRTLSVSDFGFSDIDGDAFAGVRFGTAPTGGTLYYDADGPGVGNAPVAVTTFPTTTYTAADLAAGRITFVPTANLNGSAAAAITFSVVDDGGTVGAGQNADLSPNTLTFTIDAVNDPIASNAPAALSVGEDTTTAIPGLSISDVDAALAPAGVYEVTLSATQGNLTLATLAGLTFTTGDGGDDTVMTFHGTIADINAALATATFSPTPGYSGSAQIDIQATDSFGGVVATGAGSATNDGDTIAVTVVANNPAPVLDLNGADAGTGIDYVFDEQGGSIVAPDAIVSDLTSANFDGGTLTVSYGAAMDPTDAFGVSDEGGFFATGGRIGVNNDNIYYDRVLIGTLSSFGLGQPLVITLNSAATPEAVQRLVQRVSIFNASDTPPVGTRALVFSLDDGDGNVGSATANVTITAVNDAPVIANLDGDTATLTEADSAASQIAYLDAAANAVVTDADSVNFNGGTLDIRITSGFVANQDQLGIAGTARVSIAGNFVLVDGTAVGTFTGGGPGQNFITLTLDDANPDRVQEVLRAVFQYNSAGEPTPGLRGITVTLSDGDGGSTVANVSVDVVAVNDAPVLTSLIPSVTVSEATVSAPIIIDSSVTFFDPEGNLASGNLTVSGLLAEDRIAIRNQGTGALQIGVNGANVTFQGVVIGTFIGGVGNSFTVTFNSSATNSGVDALIQNLTYQNVSDTPTANRTLSYVVTDGAGASSIPATVSLTVTPTNDAPAVAANAGTVDEGGDLVLSAATLDYNDPEQGDASIEYLIDALPTRGTLLLNGVALAVNGTFTQADINAGRVTYRHDGSETIADSFQFTVSDNAGANVTGQTFTLSITPMNDAPSSTGFDNIIYTEGDGVRNLDVGFNQVLTDPDSANFDGGTLTVAITGNKVATEDQLTITTGGTSFLSANGGVLSYQGVAIATYNTGGVGIDRVFTFNASATLEAVQTVMRNIAYINTNQANPSTDQRTVSYMLTDGEGGTLNLTSTIEVVDVNDAPVVDLNGADAGADNSASYTEQAPVVSLASGLTLSDVDSATLTGATVQITGGFVPLAGDGADYLGINGSGAGTISGITYSYSALTGILTLSGTASVAAYQAVLAQVTFQSTTNNPGASKAVTWTVSDGSHTSAAATTTITVTEINDAPVNSVPGAQNGTEDTNLVFSTANGNAITVSDRDATTLTVTISVANGVLTLSGTAGLSFGAGDGTGDATMTFTGTAAAINAALNGLIYRGNLNYEGADSLSITTSDNGQTGTGGTLTDNDSVAITLADDGRINGDAGNNILNGTPGADFFDLRQGGDDTASGGGGNDGFYFGGAYTSADVVDGGAGTLDQVGLQGDYSAGVTLGSLNGVEQVVLLSGSDTRFGDTANNFYDYNITSSDASVAAGQRLIIQANTLRIGEDLTFNGSAETDGSFLIYGGLGVDILTGGAGNDGFFFGQGRFGASDVVNGGGGNMDQLGLQGNFNITFGAAQLSGIEFIVLLSASDNRFGADGGSVSYVLTMNDGNVAAGQTMVISATTLRAGESLNFNGSAETNGRFEVYSGDGNDVITGGAGNDLIFGGGRGDTLTGGGGNDVFAYRALTDSNSTERDGIQDFNLGDRIDLSRIDANLNLAGMQSFNFVGTSAFTGTAGELRYENISLGGPIYLIQGDANGDGVSDLEIVLVITDGHALTVNDFIGVNTPTPQEPLKLSGGFGLGDGAGLLTLDLGAPDELALKLGGAAGGHLNLGEARVAGGLVLADLVDTSLPEQFVLLDSYDVAALPTSNDFGI